MPILTALSVKNYKAQKKRREIRDSQSAGLYLVIQAQPSGSKSWALRFRRPNGKPAKLVLGSVDFSDETRDEAQTGAPMTLGQTRQMAASIARHIDGEIITYLQRRERRRRRVVRLEDQWTPSRR
jgi:Arm DNA-binding domain